MSDATTHAARRTPKPAAVITDLSDRDPRRVGHWTLLGRVGIGGMGTVYLGRHPSGYQAAVKVMSEVLGSQPEFRTRFARELHTLQRVRGPFVADVLEGDAWADQPWIATEYVAGPDLARFVHDQGPVAPGEWPQLAYGMMSALGRVHHEGVVHRDIKPANVLMSPEGMRIIDFGVATAVDATMLTSTGRALGTPAWLAPEQIEGADATPASDMFAAGATLAFAATGRPPFDRTNTAATFQAVLNDDPDLTGIDDANRTLILGLLDKNPHTRWTAHDAATYLGSVAADLPSTRPMTHPWDSATQAYAPPDLGPIHADPATRQLTHTGQPSGQPPARGRRRWLVAGAAASVAALLIALIALGFDYANRDSLQGSTTSNATGTRTDPATAQSASGNPGPDRGQQLSSQRTTPTADAPHTVVQQIPVGQYPVDAAITPDSRFAYIPSYSDGQVDVVNTATGRVVDIIGLEPGLSRAITDRSGRTVLIANSDTGTISAIDTRTREVSDEYLIGGEPQDGTAVPGTSTVYWTDASSNELVAMDSITGTVTDRVTVGQEPRSAAASPDGSRVFVANYASGTVSVVDTTTNRVRDTIPIGGSPRAMTPVGADSLYVTNIATNTVSVLNTTTGKVVDVIPVGRDPRAITALPDGSAVYSVSSTDDRAWIIDTQTRTVTRKVRTGQEPAGAAALPDGTAVYIANGDQDTVTVIG